MPVHRKAPSSSLALTRVLPAALLLGSMAVWLVGCAKLTGLGGVLKGPFKPAPVAAAVAPVQAPQKGTGPDRGKVEPPQPGRDQAAASPNTESGEAQWRTTGEALGLRRQDAAADDGASPGEAAQTPPFTPEGIEGQVAARCVRADGGRRGAYLPGLVAELYAAGIPPADATQALIKADCGTLADIVRTMAAAGGEAAVGAVVSRALFLAGPRAEGVIEAAASAGLKRGLGSMDRERRGEPGLRLSSYAMAYFPSGAAEEGGGPPTRGGAEVASLYNLATPGYGIYTYVLLGKGFPDLPEADAMRYRELLRLIQTYILASDTPGAAPDDRAHAFLLAVYPWRKGQPLIEQTGPELSDGMRDALAEYIGAVGDADLAQRVAKAPGPFLVSGTEPRLIPSTKVSPRLVADLSGLAPEYLYPLVDAYDRPIGDQDIARSGGLGPLRERLTHVFHAASSGGEGRAAAQGQPVVLLGGEPTAVAAASGAASADGQTSATSEAGQRPGRAGPAPKGPGGNDAPAEAASKATPGKTALGKAAGPSG